MTSDENKRKKAWGWGIPASFVIHAVIAFVVLVGIPIELPTPEAEEVVSVEIVPPEEQQAEQPAPPPAEESQEQAEAAAPEPPAADVPDTPEQGASAQTLDSFRPVFQFGEEDAGPKAADDGAAAQEEQTPDTPAKSENEQQAELPDDANPVADDSAEPPEQQADAAAEAQRQAEEQAEDQNATAGASVPEDIAVPDVGLGSTAGEAVGIPVPTPRADALNAQIAAANPPKAEREVATTGLKPAEQLFSPSATENPMAAIAMGSMSRSERAAELCNTELREQLRHGSPSYNPNLLPKPRLTGNNVIDVKAIGFRARDQWYDVSFRCEVDKDAMKVVSFGHQVGGAIPKSEWSKRGFPAY